MVKAASLFALAGVAGADTVALSFKDCGSSSTHAKITGLNPETIDLPGKATVVGSGDLDADQTSASFQLKVKKGLVPLVSGKGSICEDTTIKVPLGAGSFTVKGLDCPIKAGSGLEVQVDLDILSSFQDGENDLVDIHIEANADDTGDQVICLDIAANQAYSWEEYKQEFNKVYNGDEEESRKAIFESNKAMWGQHESGAVLGATQFSDLTLEEFQALPIRGLAPGLMADLPHLGSHEIDPTVDSSATIDWVSKGAVTPVKDQGQCGSCWAFSTTGGLEGAWELATGNLVSMSEQQFVDCSKQNSGCNGGLMDSAFSWARSHSIATESSYSYTARDGTCKSSYTTAIPSGGVTGYKDCSGTSALTNALQSRPVSVAIQADQAVFQQYKSGTITSGCGSNLDHGVTAVGINSDGSLKVKNSWGSRWGSNGYVNIATSQCGITSQPSYPTVSGSVEV